MDNEERREFIKQLVKGTAYAAPVVHSLAAPLDLLGQGKASEHKKPRSAASQGQSEPVSSPFPPPPGQ